MKNSLKALLIVAGATLASSVAQANVYTEINSDTLVDTLTGNNTLGMPHTFTVTSTVFSDGVAGDPAEYEYKYTVSATAPSVDQFSVEGIIHSFELGIQNPAGFTGVLTGTEVNWNTPTTVPATETSLDNLVFTLTSPYGPESGNAGAQDSATWSDIGSVGVNVPGNLPDGGLTMTLLGGTLLGLGALRRKLGC